MESSYRRLGAAVSINAVLMFFLTYALLDSTHHYYVNINRMYMALMMTLPMVVVMLLVMRPMYTNRRLNSLLHASLAAAFIVVFTLARTQTPVDDVQFLRSMIPHHSSAIVMCERASITDPEIARLCDGIVEAQQREIVQMQALLQRH